MGLVDNGKQIVVFDYKQKGTSEGFNKLLYNMIPKGIIKGGTLVKNTDASIYVTPFLAFFEDISKKIGIRLETTENASVDVSVSKPFVIIRFSWLNLEDNFMDIISASSTEIEETDFILGRCIFDSSTLTTFDYSKKSWAKSYYDKDIDFEPSFLVSANEPYDNKLKVGKGSAYINGKKVVFDVEKQTPTFDLNVTNGRKDLVVINDDATISIIKGTDNSVPVAPLFPVKGLVVAIVTLPPNPTSVNGSFVEYLYNNNFYSTQISNLVNEATSLPTANKIAIRDGSGRLQVADPTNNLDATNKQTVVSLVNDLAIQNWTAIDNLQFGTSGAYAVTYGNGKFVAVGETGKGAYSTDGVTWKAISNLQFGTNLAISVTYGNGKFVAVGVIGKGAYSTDGVTWTAISNLQLSTETLRSVTYGNGKFVAVGETGKGAYSTDGVTWKAISNLQFGTNLASSVTYGNGKFVAVGATGKGSYSTDGVTWKAISNLQFGTTNVHAVTYGNGKFVAVGGSGKGAYSTDGVTWTAISNLQFGTSGAYAVTYGNGKFVAVGLSGKGAYSTDGVTWTAISNLQFGTNFAISVTYGNGKFVAVGATGKGAYSLNLIS